MSFALTPEVTIPDSFRNSKHFLFIEIIAMQMHITDTVGSQHSHIPGINTRITLKQLRHKN